MRKPNQSTLLILIAAAIVPAGLVAFTMIAQSAVAASFSAVVGISIALPPLLRQLHRPILRLLASGLSVVAIALLLLGAPMSAPQWFGVVAIVAAMALFLAGVVWGFGHAAIVVVMLAWLSWPIWLSERLAGHEWMVSVLATVHPLLAINGQLLDQSIWTERPLMYGWTGLNQDVPFAIPTTIVWCVLLHGGLGIVCLVISRVRQTWTAKAI